jgi:hypothetical protein
VRRRTFRSWAVAGLAAALLSAICVAGAGAVSSSGKSTARAAATARPLHTAVLDPHSFAIASAADKRIAFRRMRTTGARFVRLFATWPAIAPGGATKPAGFDARNPTHPMYRWADLDAELRLVASSGLTPIVYVQGAPDWAWGGEPTIHHGPIRPSPSELADFATALARRYDGSGLPRVRYWQVWNEPNLWQFLMPQTESGKTVSPAWYRSMVNAMGKAVHAVRRDNVVIAGALAPYGGDKDRIRPLQFMREMLCMSGGARPRATCNEKTELDVWAHHAYSYGGPTSQAIHRDDAAVGDLGEMRRLLMAADRAGHIVGRGPDFWVTEYSYESRPPDPKGVPLALHTRWVAESLYRMWQDGVSLVTWFYLRDGPTDQPFQSGLYYRSERGIAADRPKPALRAFRFPFVAFREKGGAISFWGRTPGGVKRAVVVEQQVGSRWRRVATPGVDRYGIFQGRVAKAPRSSPLRARGAGDVSVPFSLKVPKDQRFCLFGIIC